MTFELDIPAVRGCAAATRDVGARAVAGAAHTARVEVVPRWAVSTAADLLTEITRRDVTVAGHDVTEAADRIDAAVTDLLAADDRAAQRLRRVA